MKRIENHRVIIKEQVKGTGIKENPVQLEDLVNQEPVAMQEDLVNQNPQDM